MFITNARFTSNRMTGVPRSAYEIVSRLVSSDGESHRLVAPRIGGEAPTPLPVERRGYIRQGHLWEQIELPGIVRKAGGENAVLFSPATSGPLAVRRQVMVAHDLFPIENPEWYSRAFSSWYGWLWPRLFPRVERILVNSNYTRERLLDRFSLSEYKVAMCHFAHDSERFAMSPEEEVSRFRGEQNLPERYLLYIGSIEPRKNLSTLVAAWKRTSAREQGVKLVVAGGAGRKDIFNSVGSGADVLEDPSIQLLGFFPDEHLPLLYQGAEALALPSLAEGFGLPILEAMACGTPVICADNTAMPEVAGGAARLVPTMDTEAWKEAMDETLSNAGLRSEMREAGLKRASEFSWERTAMTVRSLLKAV